RLLVAALLCRGRNLHKRLAASVSTLPLGAPLPIATLGTFLAVGSSPALFAFRPLSALLRPLFAIGPPATEAPSRPGFVRLCSCPAVGSLGRRFGLCWCRLRNVRTTAVAFALGMPLTRPPMWAIRTARPPDLDHGRLFGRSSRILRGLGRKRCTVGGSL